MGDVEPLPGKAGQRVERGTGEMPAATPAQLERRDAALGISRRPSTDPNPLTLGEVPTLHPLETLEWKKDGVQRGVFARLKTGAYPVDGSLDLHRLTVKESRIEMLRFFELAQARGWRTLLIAHGRGEHSATPARIKSYVAAWLRQLPQVIAYHSADRRQGGTGAVLVLVKKSAQAKEAARESYGRKTSGDDEPDRD